MNIMQKITNYYYFLNLFFIDPFSGNEHLSNNRYLPPVPAKEFEKLMLYILSMIHKRPFLKMRFPPRGSVASLKAVNNEYYSIMFR